MGDGELWIVIPHWEEFQHRDVSRSDNVPPWIKAYTKLLSDDDFLDLSHHLRGVLLGLWLEYARSTRQLRDSTVTLTRRLGQRVMTRDLQSLNDAGFITFVASKPLAARQQTASLEEIRVEPPLPPAGKASKTRRRRKAETKGGPTHEDANPFVCGIDGCLIRDATEKRILEHREIVHGAAVSSNGHIDSLQPDTDDIPLA